MSWTVWTFAQNISSEICAIAIAYKECNWLLDKTLYIYVWICTQLVCLLYVNCSMRNAYSLFLKHKTNTFLASFGTVVGFIHLFFDFAFLHHHFLLLCDFQLLIINIILFLLSLYLTIRTKHIIITI